MSDNITISSELNTTDGDIKQPDLTAFIVTPTDGKSLWGSYFTAFAVNEGYFKGEDEDGNTIIVQTLTAKTALTGQRATEKRWPDLYIYIETIENGEKIWTEILVVWKGQSGYFTGKLKDGRSVVIQPKALADKPSQQIKQVAPVDIDTCTAD